VGRGFEVLTAMEEATVSPAARGDLVVGAAAAARSVEDAG
jgi:hypothetical protein